MVHIFESRVVLNSGLGSVRDIISAIYCKPIYFGAKEKYVQINYHENVHIGILYIVLAYSSSAINENKSAKMSMKTKTQKQMSRAMRKQTFFMCENKDADQLRHNREADQRLCFRYIDRTIYLLSKSKISSL